MIKKIGLIGFIFFLVSTYAYGESVLKSSLVSTTHTPSQWSTNNRITVKWTKPGPDERYGAVRGYSYVWDTDASTNPGGSLMLDASVTELTSQPLADGQNIYFHIRVIYENGSPYEWDDLGPFWIDATPPSKPTNLNISPGDGKLTLSWDPPRDTDFDHVTIRRLEAQGSTCSYPSSPSEGAAVADVSKGTTSYVDTGLTNGKTYCYSLFAYDAHGNYSEPAQANGAPRSEAQVTYATVSSTDPSNNATDVPVTSPITISFTKDMNFGTISSSTILVKDSDGNTVTGEWSQVTSKVAKFTPSQALSYSKTYIVTILGGSSGVKDSAGNWFDGNGDGSAGTQDNYTFSFTTAAYQKPTVSSVSPSSGMTGVDPLTAITITFSKAMDPTSITATTVTVTEGDKPKSGSVTYNAADKTATFVPSSPFTGGANVSVTVKGGDGGVKDESGVPMERDYTFSFTIKNTPIIDVSPQRLEFGATTQGSTKDMTLTVTNKGRATLTFGTVSISDSSYFSVQENLCTSDLSYNQTCTITVRFSPGTTTDVKTGTLTIPSNSGRGDDQTLTETRVSLSGYGVAQETPSLSVSPTSLEFPRTVVNQESESKQFIITNNGTANSTLSISSIQFQSGVDFKGTVSCKGGGGQNLPLTSAVTLAQNESCTVNVIFAPKSSGDKTDIVTISSNAGSRTVNLYGTAVTYYTFTLNLQAGWNLISLPLEPEDPRVENAIKNFSPYVSAIWEFTPPDTWKRYTAFKQEFTRFAKGKGYWVYVNATGIEVPK